MAGVAFSTAALIIVLSVFNGLEDLLRSLYTSFDPQLKVSATVGKSFAATDSLLSKIKETPGVEIVTEVIEDYAYVRYRDASMVATLRGVSNNFIDQHRLDDHMIEGELKLWQDSIPFAIVGSGVRHVLTVAVDEDRFALQVFYIKNINPGGSLDPSRLYTQKSIRPGGVFSIEKNFDENYIFLPLQFVQELLNYGNKRTFLEVKVSENTSVTAVQQRLKALLGDNFQVLTNQEQHKDLYRLMKLEKLFTFLSLSLLMLVGAINIFFSLMMLALDKKKDITILSAVGADQTLIRNIFLTEGGLIAGIGAVTGLVLGGLICWLQDRFGLVSMGMDTAVMQSYPVRLRAMDFVSTSAVIVIITLLVSTYPARQAARSSTTEYL